MTMTTGEFEYDTIFRQCQDSNCEDELTYVTASFLLWIIFLILMPILFTNLLVRIASFSYHRVSVLTASYVCHRLVWLLTTSKELWNLPCSKG